MDDQDEVLEALSDLVSMQREIARRTRELWELIEGAESAEAWQRAIAITTEVRK